MEKVLVIEDDEVLNPTVKKDWEREGWELFFLSSPSMEKVIEIIDREKIDIVFIKNLYNNGTKFKNIEEKIKKKSEHKNIVPFNPSIGWVKVVR